MFLQNAVCMVSRWYFDYLGGLQRIQKATFTSMSPYFNVKLSLFLTEVSFETSEENQLSYFQNGYFFKILWWSHEPHYKGICRWRNEIISECFTINNHGFYFVSFSTNQTLGNQFINNQLSIGDIYFSWIFPFPLEGLVTLKVSPATISEF